MPVRVSPKPTKMGLCLMALVLNVNAAIVVSVTASEGGGDLLGGPASSTEFVSWSSVNPYSAVIIAAQLGTFDLGATGTAFLMNQVGPGTTVTNQISMASYTVSSADPDATLVPLFSGLTLPSGKYYLVITGPANPPVAAFWRHVFGQPTIVTGTGVVLTDWGFASTDNPSTIIDMAYPPASVFAVALPPHNRFTVTGTLIPEPQTGLLFSMGGLTLLFYAYARLGSRKLH